MDGIQNVSLLSESQDKLKFYLKPYSLQTASLYEVRLSVFDPSTRTSTSVSKAISIRQGNSGKSDAPTAIVLGCGFMDGIIWSCFRRFNFFISFSCCDRWRGNALYVSYRR